MSTQLQGLLDSDAKVFRALTEDASDIIVIVNREGNIQYVNSAVERILGRKTKSRMGACATENVHPDDFHIVQTSFNHLTQNKNAPPEQTEIRIRHSDRSWRTFDCIARNFPGDHLHDAIVVNLIDITERKCMEDALRASEEKYSALIEKVTDGISIIQDDVIKFANNRLAEISGYSVEELTGMSVYHLVPSDFTPTLIEEISLLEYKDVETRIFHSLLLCKDGSIREIENSAKVIRHENRKALLAFSRDITERHKVERQLLLISKAVESSGDAIGLSDPDGNHFYHNEAFVRLFGYSVNELQSLGGGPIIYKNHETAKEVFQTIKEGGSWVGETEFVSKDGRVFLTMLRADAIKDDSGNVVGLIGLHTDISERKRTEEIIRESEEKYHLLADHMKDQVWLMDLNLGWKYISPSVEKLWGYNLPELIRLPLDKLLTATSYKIAMDFFTAKMSRPLVYTPSDSSKSQLELEYRCRDGRTLWTETTFSFIRDDKGNPLYILCEGRDITERKKTEEKLQETLTSLKNAVGATINVLVSVLESRDPYTAGHQSRAANLACAIAAEMGLDKDKIEGLRLAGSIHDIGKLSVPAEILTKPTKLSDLEFSLIKAHSQNGYEMLRHVESPWPLAKIVHQHHERMDGSGYPGNLQADEILMEARILAVADVVEAMASHRPYRPSLGIDVALEEIERKKGTLYDSNVTDACLRLFREKGYQLV